MLYHSNGPQGQRNLVRAAVFGLMLWVWPWPGGAHAQPIAVERPSAATAIEAYNLVEPWIRALAVPDQVRGPSVGAASVTLRLRGRIVGRATTIGLGDSCLPEAARAAQLAAETHLTTVNDASASEQRRLAAQELALTVEVGSDPIPVDERSYEAVSAVVPQGIEGVAVRLGGRSAAVLPMEMLSTAQPAGRAASRLVAQLTGDPIAGLRPLEPLLQETDARVFRLRTRAAAQLAPGQRPQLLERGGRLVNLGDVTAEALGTMAIGLAGYLSEHGDSGMYLPTPGENRGPLTPLAEAVRLLALTRYEQRFGALAELDDAPRAEGWASAGPGAAAILAVALHERGRADAAAWLERALGRDEAGRPDWRSAPEPERAALVWALAKLGQTEAASQAAAALRSVRHPSQLMAHMPWLGWAEIELAGAGEIPSAVALRELRRTIREFQITHADAGPDEQDLVGGVVFVRASVPLPTWQTARALAFTATMLGDARLTEPQETAEQAVALLHGLRYLMQLSASEAEAHLYADPGRALWGTRAAVWDHTMPLEASAMTLLTVLETLDSLDAMAAAENERRRRSGP